MGGEQQLLRVARAVLQLRQRLHQPHARTALGFVLSLWRVMSSKKKGGKEQKGGVARGGCERVCEKEGWECEMHSEVLVHLRNLQRGLRALLVFLQRLQRFLRR